MNSAPFIITFSTNLVFADTTIILLIPHIFAVSFFNFLFLIASFCMGHKFSSYMKQAFSFDNNYTWLDQAYYNIDI